MERVDLTKLDVAIQYINRLANGSNPVNNAPLEEDAILNNPNVIRCMHFVKEVLEDVRRNDGYLVRTCSKSRIVSFPFEVLNDFRYEADKTIVHLIAQMYAPLGESDIKKIAPQTITNWLKKEGYLVKEFRDEVGKETFVPTEQGKQLGIYTEVKVYSNSTYVSVVYNRQAQEFLVKNMEAIINDAKKEQDGNEMK